MLYTQDGQGLSEYPFLFITKQACKGYCLCINALVLVRNRVFGCMKGASDGGLDIPHNEKRFPGYDRDTKSYDVSIFVYYEA